MPDLSPKLTATVMQTLDEFVDRADNTKLPPNENSVVGLVELSRAAICSVMVNSDLTKKEVSILLASICRDAMFTHEHRRELSEQLEKEFAAKEADDFLDSILKN